MAYPLDLPLAHGQLAPSSPMLTADLAADLAAMDPCTTPEGMRRLATEVEVYRAQGHIAEDALVLAWLACTGQLPWMIDQGRTMPAAAFAPCEVSGVYPVVADLDLLEGLCRAGVRIIQLRLKSSDQTALRTQITRAIELGRGHPGCTVVINDHWALALELGAQALHLGQEDLASADLCAIQAAGMSLGISTHCPIEVARAIGLRPSYLAVGPIRPTYAKAMPWAPQGLNNLAFWVQTLAQSMAPTRSLPVVAIGGLKAQDLSAVRQAGASSAAVISAITEAEDPIAAYHDLMTAWNAPGAPAAAHTQTPIVPRLHPTIDDTRLGRQPSRQQAVRA